MPEAKNAVNKADKLAFDRQSVRSFDADGMLHVETTPISKSNICIYYGREIPDWESMGLNANYGYRLLRDPAELERGAPTFNNKPVLNTHLPFLASNPPQEAIIGSTGESARMVGDYLQNSIVVWSDKAIAGIESGQQREISSSYRYRADMTPGVYNGEEYDGVMRDIVCNHVAVVPSGRAGPDVLVYDEKPKGYSIMSKLDKLWAKLLPHLAADAEPEEVKKELKNLVEDEDEDEKKDKPKTADDEQTEADKDDESEAERLKREEKELKEREEREDADRKKDREMANDAKLAMDALESKLARKFKDLREAERMCEPLIGNVACDSAEEVYRMALEHHGVKGVKGIHASALKPMVELLQGKKMANDSAPERITSDVKANVMNLINGGK